MRYNKLSNAIAPKPLKGEAAPVFWKRRAKVAVLKRECYEDLRREHLAPDWKSAGPCISFEDGQELLFERFDPASCGFPCMEAWDAIGRCIYTGLQGGSIMGGWIEDPKIMIACRNDGTRLVVFKTERNDD